MAEDVDLIGTFGPSDDLIGTFGPSKIDLTGTFTSDSE